MLKGTALIAGGGIGGLATALGLARSGIPSVVLEQAPTLAEIGAGIQLGPNAFHAFDRLKIGEEARATAVYVDKLRLMNAVTGEEIVHLPLDAPFRARFGNPYAVAHRGDLYRALLAACRSTGLVDLRTNQLVEGYEQDGSTVRVHIAGGGACEGAVLIGADGLRSNVRRQLVADGEPRVSGHTSYRSVIPTELMPEDLRWNAATLWAGPKVHLVHYPLTDWKLFNLVVTCHNDPPRAAAGEPVAKDEVRRWFTHIAPQAQQIIEHGQEWRRWVLCDRDPVDRWVDGRVTLLGDAAHPMLQYAAQGACMALEDAVCVSYMLAKHEDANAALLAYQQQRVARTARLQVMSRLIGEFIYHPDGALALMRDTAMRAMTPADYYDRLFWLYGEHGPGAAT
ncbi:MAG TPA: 3-hydroxybenzoate 6-monooxygenase [Hyphomicrobiaceae bacterium]|jgi:salicylate hydroxylase|nr:3-hydroxybenzoate 6-monooxygenase [Hyphomicrobiaceae bacterium]